MKLISRALAAGWTREVSISSNTKPGEKPFHTSVTLSRTLFYGNGGMAGYANIYISFKNGCYSTRRSVKVRSICDYAIGKTARGLFSANHQIDRLERTEQMIARIADEQAA